MKTFKTISAPATAVYKEKGSKFLAYAFPVQQEQQIKEHLETLKKEHYNARHHCFAWRLGASGEHYRTTDAGEPVNSAGPPILGQIRAFELTNILMVVVRYFGGTKLGVGGLMQAYKTAAAEALKLAETIEDFEKVQILMQTNYINLNDLMGFIKQQNVEINYQSFLEKCFLSVVLPSDEKELFLHELSQLNGISLAS